MQKTAGNCRFSQETADFCRNRFLPFAVSLLARSKIGGAICEKQKSFTQAESSPAERQSENAGPRLLALSPISNYFSNV